MNDIIEKIQTVALDALEKYGHLAENDNFGHVGEWDVLVDDLSQQNRQALGLCKFLTKDIIIDINHVKENDWSDVLDTVMHEVAHALAGVEISPKGRMMGHGKRWKRWAKRLGATPKAKAKFSNDEAQDRIHRSSKYVIMYIDGDHCELVTSCDRKLKNLRGKMMPNRPNTSGKLFYIHTERYYENEGNVEYIKKQAFQ